MRWRWIFGAIATLTLARWWIRRNPELPATIVPSLAQRAQAFLDAHNLFNLSGSIDLIELLGNASLPRPGLRDGAPQKKHPVVIVPGITSCGLEVWKARPCLGEHFFRRRIWGDLSMAEAVISNWSCWLQHISPDPLTGVDREGIKVRAAKGLKSADYFVGSYWLWSKVIQNLADIGYTEDDINLACYDWRIAFPLLEKRDRYLSGLKHDIEKAVDVSGEKVVVIAHSMGANLFYFFMSWVERQVPGWVDRYVASFVNIAGPLLGAMGPLAGFLSGEMDATAAMGPLNSYIEALALTWDEARDIYWSMGGVGALLPMGGSVVWGSGASGWTDTPVDTVDFGTVASAPQSLEELFDRIESDEQKPLRSYPAWASYEKRVVNPGVKVRDLDPDDPQRFGNPLASSLPKAPQLKVFCFYGHGLPTERAYKYGMKAVRWAFADAEFLPERRLLIWSSTKPLDATIAELQTYLDTSSANRPVRLDTRGDSHSWPNVADAIRHLQELHGTFAVEHAERWIRINGSFHSSEAENPWGNRVDGVYAYGVAKTDGDSTVPLVSLGYMCTHGWREFSEFNPANVSVWTREFDHEPLSVLADPRGGPASAKHVEIIGNTELIADLLNIAAGETKDLEQDRIVSNITRVGPIISARLRQALSA